MIGPESELLTCSTFVLLGRRQELHSCLRHTEGAAPGDLDPRREGGAVDGEDRLSPLLLVVSSFGSHVVSWLLPGAQQPVGHQPLPGAAEVRPLGV